MKSTAIALLFVFVLAISPASGAVKVTGDFSSLGGASVEFTKSIMFTVTQDTNVVAVIFEDWVVSDGTTTIVLMEDLTYFINASSPSETTGTDLTDNHASSVDGSGINPNDGYFFFDVIAANNGDTFTFLAQTVLNTAMTSDMNPALSDLTFNGNAFLVDSGGNQVSDLVAVPEPATWGAFLGLSSLLWVMIRRRRSAA